MEDQQDDQENDDDDAQINEDLYTSIMESI